jgi:hypothetical protein
MSNKQQTAVDFLIAELGEFFPHGVGGIELMVKQAKEMEKQQIAKAFDDGDYNYHYSRKTGNDFEDGQEYFNELYGIEEL